jgi:ADP-ribose pyrophosphatase YjhB (NUDIX family)
VKRSIALVIESGGAILLVRRPDDDADLPGLWGLPAASLQDGESEHEALLRAGRDKLGVEIEPTELVGEEGSLRDWGARVVSGEPRVPQPAGGTQYVELRWGEPAELAPAARAGSLCARALLRSVGSSW